MTASYQHGVGVGVLLRAGDECGWLAHFGLVELRHAAVAVSNRAASTAVAVSNRAAPTTPRHAMPRHATRHQVQVTPTDEVGGLRVAAQRAAHDAARRDTGKWTLQNSYLGKDAMTRFV